MTKVTRAWPNGNFVGKEVRWVEARRGLRGTPTPLFLGE